MKRVAVPFVLCGALLLAACGAGDDDAPTVDPTATAASASSTASATVTASAVESEASATAATGSDGGDAATPSPTPLAATPSVADRLPPPLGECGGARFQVTAVEVPFGEPLGNAAASGSATADYLIPAGATTAFITVTVPEAGDRLLRGEDIAERFPDSDLATPNTANRNPAMTAVIDVSVGESTTEVVELIGMTEADFAASFDWAGFRWDDFFPPPYAYGDRVHASISFVLEGARYSWTSRSNSADCAVR